MTSKTPATVYGYPRQGQDRELKRAVEGYWKGRVGADALRETARDLRRTNWQQLADTGITELPTGDFSYYDHVLDTSVMVGAIPARHRAAVDADALDGYFAMARGTQEVAPLEMTKWFDTNYHYLVPELGPDTVFTADSSRQVAEFEEARTLGHRARPVLVGPVTYLLLAKPAPEVAAGFDPLALLDRLLPVYARVLADLRAAGAEWVQLDEPALVQDRTPAELNAAARAYRVLGGAADRPKLLVASYFDRLGEALPVLAKAPVDGLALDFTGAAAANLDALAAVGGLPGKRLVAGVVDGRNIWINDLEKSLGTLGTLLGLAGSVDVAASCSLLHVPLDASAERDVDPQVRRWLAFARRRPPRSPPSPGASPAARTRSRPNSPPTGPTWPPPTTTIGSFPQTGELRTARADLRAGRTDTAGYEDRIRAEIREVLAFQEKAGLDVLVHGEPERADMVQYFAEQLTGYLATQHGWVQSYGTRYVRPPVLAGDVSRPDPMTVRWTTYAQSQTAKPVKGMLTGPVTMLAWSLSLIHISRWPCATRWTTWRPPVPPSSRWTSPRCGRRSRCAAPTGRPTSTGPPRPSGSPPAASGRTPRSTRTCATRSSVTSSGPSGTSTPTSSAWKPPAPTCRSPTSCPAPAIRARSARASGTSTRRGSPPSTRPRRCCAGAWGPSPPSGCGSIPTAG